MDNKRSITILGLTIPLVILIAIVSVCGLFVPGTYSQETPNWTAQAIGQDAADLFMLTPFLLITAIFASRRSRTAMLLWSGAIFYTIYTFVIYCFAIHFNYLFLAYCFILGLAFYLFIYFLLSNHREPVREWFGENLPVKTAGIYMIVIAGLFFLLWISQVIPAMISNAAPAEVQDIGTLTNPVHALDLSVVLPGFIITAILLLKKKPLGFLMTPTVLTFMVLMDITLAGLVIVMDMKGLETNPVMPVIMIIFAVVSGVILVSYLKTQRRNNKEDVTARTDGK
ncbi:hypothetical protein JXI42_05250 [bacterium]|nr:hypothetical protein [bacterium]